MADFDLASLMQQAQAFQEKLRQMQEEVASKTVEAQSGGGMVKVVVDGGMRVRKIEIDKTILAAGDQAMLEDLIVVAVNDGLARAQQLVTEEMGKMGPFGGLKIPGFPGA
jgi:nucleoid-associated protein EbfC